MEFIPVEENDPSEPKLILKRIRENSTSEKVREDLEKTPFVLLK